MRSVFYESWIILQLTCEGIKRLAEVLNNPKAKVEVLNLSLNSIKQDGCKYLCKVRLKANTSIRTLTAQKG